MKPMRAFYYELLLPFSSSSYKRNSKRNSNEALWKGNEEAKRGMKGRKKNAPDTPTYFLFPFFRTRVLTGY